MIDPYLAVKWVHIVSSTVLFGTGVGTALQMVLAHRSRDVRAIATVTRNVVLADWLCTVPSGIVQPISGVFLMWMAGYDPEATWLVLAYCLYAIAGICWFRVVWLQLGMRDLAAIAAGQGEALPPAYYRKYREWFVLGWPAFFALMGVFALMVAKPG